MLYICRIGKKLVPVWKNISIVVCRQMWMDSVHVLQSKE